MKCRLGRGRVATSIIVPQWAAETQHREFEFRLREVVGFPPALTRLRLPNLQVEAK